MSTTFHPTNGTVGNEAATTRTTHPLRRATLLSGVIAAAATTAAAAALDGAGVPFAVDGETIPLAGYAQMTLLGAIVGGLLVAALNRRSSHARRRFLQIAVALTAASCVPSVVLPPDTATKLALVATHLIAAAIVVPTLARHTRG